MIPRPIQRLIDDFQKLPGVGPKTAQRLAFYILRMPGGEVEKFAQNLIKAKNDVTMCSICRNIDETSPCSLCTDSTRTEKLIAVVSTPLDLISMERAGFKGKYHVLHGVIDPLNGVGPEELYIDDLIGRVDTLQRKMIASENNDNNENDAQSDQVITGEGERYIRQVIASEQSERSDPATLELILALSTSLEGESTALYIQKILRDKFSSDRLKISRLARGLPVGGDVEYADEVTLSKALEGRVVV